MAKAEVGIDYRAARGSNTGDEFHELWAVRQALRLLDATSGLSAITVEGLTAQDDEGAVWDGVDCALLFGSATPASASRVELQQLKYSASDPNKPWTVARLATGRDGKTKTSPIRRLAEAFSGLLKKRDGLSLESVSIALVSNQPIAVDLIDVINTARDGVPATYGKAWTHPAPDLHRLVYASGLSPKQFQTFAQVLDLQGSSGSRFEVEDLTLKAVSSWTDTDLREATSRLREYMRKRMLPEAAGEIITREKVLIQFGGVSDDHALFPCPQEISRAVDPVRRSGAASVAAALNSGQQYICLHGAGGVGKTTALQEVESLLPVGSAMIVFDCYGGGSYLDASALRHRHADAFVQLANDIARTLRLPLLLEPRAARDYARAFRQRLELAAETLPAAAPSALLVVAIDAADNSVTAAQTRSPPERSFVHDLISFAGLPPSVRILISARTGRLADLQLSPAFKLIPLVGFSSEETAENVARYWDAPKDWIEDFHHLSEGIPRVQSYAFNTAKSAPKQALDALRPVGKKLDQVFRERFDQALIKNGRHSDLEDFCAGMIVLPRPIPMEELAAVLGAPEAQIKDLCADLAPGVRTTGSQIHFADEDFEAFVRDAGRGAETRLQAIAAERFLMRASADAYAALNVAPALLAANRGADLLDLVEREPEPSAATMPDPVRRREVHTQRLQAAIRVCRQAGDTARALRFVLIGAEAMGVETATRKLLADNPGLTARYARETASRLILGDGTMISDHGPLLLNLLAEDAIRGDAISVREGRRKLEAWFDARQTDSDDEEVTGHHPSAWDFSSDDAAASVYATLLLDGPAEAASRFRKIQPPEFSLSVGRSLVDRLLAEDRPDLAENLAQHLSDARAVFAMIPLAFAGRQIDLTRLTRGLSALRRRKVGQVRLVEKSWHGETLGPYVVDTILCGAEVLVSRGMTDLALQILAPFNDPILRRIDKLFDFQNNLLDAILRSHCLVKALAGEAVILDEILTPRPAPDPDVKRKGSTGEIERHDRQLNGLLAAITPFYVARAKALSTGVYTDLETDLIEAQRQYGHNSWQLGQRHTTAGMRAKIAETIASLLATNAPPAMVMERATTVRGNWWPHNEAGIEVLFKRLACTPTLHDRLVTEIGNAAAEVRKDRNSAEEKAGTLTAYARLLSTVSPADADVVFKQAIEVASELDSEIMDQVRLIAKLVRHGRAAWPADARASAVQLGEIACDASVRLGQSDHFPWDDGLSALARLDMSIAIATVARWDDARIVQLSTSLEPTIATGLEVGTLSPSQAAVLLGVLERPSADEWTPILDASAAAGPPSDLIDEIAKDILLDRASGSKVLDEALTRSAVGPSAKRLAAQNLFEKTLPAAEKLVAAPKAEPLGAESKRTVLESHDWPVQTLIDADLLGRAIEDLLVRSREAKQYIPLSAILAAARSKVPFRHRIPHLDALSRLEVDHSADDIIGAILAATEAWSSQPAIGQWCRSALPAMISDRLPIFARNLRWRGEELQSALMIAGLDDARSQAILLAGIEQNVDFLGAETTFALVGIVAQKLPDAQAASLCEWYLRRLADRVSPEDREGPIEAELPVDVDEAIGRFIYAMLSDINLNQRWRAAHMVRRLARLKQASALSELVSQYSRTTEHAFRQKNAPFYFVAARLWCLIALDRVAFDDPSAIGPFGPLLLDAALSQNFPHLLVRKFAAEACLKLHAANAISLTPAELEQLGAINTSRLPRGKKKADYRRSFERLNSKEDEKRRFHFDALDTLRYWYDPWLRIFEGVTPEKFLNLAEHWIVDIWGEPDLEPYGAKEPRGGRFPERSWSQSSNSHGALPKLERHRTYLEWHAMWCVAGELLKTTSVAPPDYDGEDELKEKIERNFLTVPPVWLADLVGPKPLELRWWQPPTSMEEWLSGASDNDFLAELASSEHQDYIVVSSHVDARSRLFKLSSRVNTGLVSPDTGHALVRALQAVGTSSDYYICPEGHDLEIDEGDFKLKGWLRHTDWADGLDDMDAFRNGVARVEARPGDLATATLDLTRRYVDGFQWVRAGRSEPTFIYQSWGEREWDEDRERHYGETVVCNGHRLLIRKDDLAELLATLDYDLIVEVEITRRDQREKAPDDEEDAEDKEVEFDRVFVLRRDGEIQAAERNLGAWRSPRP